MPFSLTMPKLSPTMEIGTIAKWHKKEGDQIEEGDLLIEVATDKATIEYNAIDAGWLRKILVQEGEDASVNQPIAIFTEKKEESIEGWNPEGTTKEKEELPKVEEKEKDEVVAKEVKKEVKREGMQQPSFTPENPLSDYEFAFPLDAERERIKSSPLARRLAKEKGLDLSTVKGTGPGGRIMGKDLVKAQKSGLVVFGSRSIPKKAPGAYEEEKLTPVRKVICQRMQEAKTFIPHFYVSQSIDASALVQAREQLSQMGIKVSFNDFVIRAASLSLREHPNVNSGFNTENQTIIRFKTIDISVAVSVEEGLITPILRHADYKNLGEISLEMRSLAKKAREGKLAYEEYKGGSFTISNMGMYGVTDFKAIINPPQAAILAVSGIHNEPVVRGGQIVAGKVMNLSLSVDHRVIDGVQAAEFIKSVQKFLENASVLLV